MGCSEYCRGRPSKTIMKDFSEIIPVLAKIAKKHGIEDLNVSAIFRCVWKNFEWLEGPPNATVTGTYELHNLNGPIDFTYDVEKLLESVIVLVKCELNPKYEGINFPKIEGAIQKCQQIPVPEDIQFNESEVTAVYFWTSWNIQSQIAITNNYEIFKKHPENNKKVHIVCLNFDEKIELAMKKIIQNKWINEDQYWVQEKYHEEIYHFFKIISIPFCLFVDKNGKIIQAGSPKDVRLENYFRDSSTKISDEELFKDINFEECKYRMKEFIYLNVDTFSKVKSPTLELECTKKLIDGKLVDIDLHMKASYTWELENKIEANKLKSDLQEEFGSITNLEIKDRSPKFIKYGEKCFNCGVVLGNCDQYRCVTCPEIYFCINCVDKSKDPNVVEDLVHPHALYLLVKNSDELLEKALFSSEMNHFSTMDEIHNSIICECCKQIPVGVRWKCLNCLSLNLCNECFKIGRNNTAPKSEENLKKIPGHNFAKHSYIRIDFN